ncbi:MAG: hypothetical protein R3213_12615, partial [Flavobacteriaceae bacterium]|nr:hypothetical protein [Flavobacteriaceae bacterium]
MQLKNLLTALLLILTFYSCRKAEEKKPEEKKKLEPFGANLFKGGFRSERESGLNPDYLVVPG